MFDKGQIVFGHSDTWVLNRVNALNARYDEVAPELHKDIALAVFVGEDHTLLAMENEDRACKRLETMIEKAIEDLKKWDYLPFEFPEEAKDTYFATLSVKEAIDRDYREWVNATINQVVAGVTD